MAMLHPDDEAFAKQQVLSDESVSIIFRQHLSLAHTRITVPESQGMFHKVYFVALAEKESHPWSGREVVLRVARRAIERVKTENEMALLRVLRAAGVPVPEVVFFSSDPNNSVGYEYNCLERIAYPSLADTWMDLSPAQLDRLLDQFVDIFVKLRSLDVPHALCSLTLNDTPGPVIEETMWTLPDIARYFHAPPYNLTSETFATLNPTGFYASWPAYICAFLKTYTHIISIHSAVDFLHILLPLLQRLIAVLEDDSVEWVRRLRDEPALRGWLAHRDFHFGNILADGETVKAVIDWEFAGIGPSFTSRASPIRNCVGYLRSLPPSPAHPAHTQTLIDTWQSTFQARLAAREPAIAAQWAAEMDRDAVLGVEGQALSDLREYLRSCLEVGVRGVGRVEAARGTWKDVVVGSLRTLGFYQEG
ncbi:phosphotransferase enzyme family-domain-containing protein [Mycena vitilis]|nr:phosphotransferase enzyme family-domain-containing protein [Mycena vitilis]